MKRFWLLAGLVIALFTPVLPAGASGDYGCDPSWKLSSDGFASCGDRGMLAPGNDTRVNLFYLLGGRPAVQPGLSYPADEWSDRTLGHSFFSWTMLRQAYDPGYEPPAYGGSRCDSLSSGANAFEAAMKASGKLPAAERDKLWQTRGMLAWRCDQKIGPNWPTEIKSGSGREFLAYLQAADAFYGEQWDASRQAFAQLRSAHDPWVAETAAYMLARSELNAGQANSFNEYGSFDGPEKTDHAAMARARAGFEDYLKRYGQGRYAGSARGLIRRVMWLEGDVAGLSREYERLLGSMPQASPGTANLIEEIDQKLLMVEGSRQAIDGPLLLATIDLLRMRSTDDSGAPQITAQALAAQAPRFAGRGDLFSFVTASHAFYVGKDMRRVLDLIPDDARQPGYTPLAFSRQVLRGMALTALRDRNEGGFWRDLLGGAKGLYQRPLVELALAMNYERNGKFADIFAAGSPILESPIREILLQYVAGPDVLRAQVKNGARPQHERDLALFTLLHKQLLYGNYAGFLADGALVRAKANIDGGLWNLREQQDIPVGLFRAGKWSDGYGCPALASTVGTLTRAPRDVKARLCLGEFYRLNGFDELIQYDVQPAADELGGTPSLFPGRAAPRGVIYSDVIADPKAAAPEKAYALYRAVNCYAPGGNNSCGGKDVAESQRKAWFQQLKRDYPKSEWAQQLRYYW